MTNTTTKRARNFSAEWRKYDPRPHDGKRTCRGDCTTRAMTYALEGLFSYREIEAEQYRLAEARNRDEGRARGDGRYKWKRNSVGVWDETIREFGWSWIKIGPVRRDRLAAILAPLSHPAISHSAGHVAAIHGGEVVDSWDSRGGRCNRVLVHDDDREAALSLLQENGVAVI